MVECRHKCSLAMVRHRSQKKSSPTNCISVTNVANKVGYTASLSKKTWKDCFEQNSYLSFGECTAWDSDDIVNNDIVDDLVNSSLNIMDLFCQNIGER